MPVGSRASVPGKAGIEKGTTTGSGSGNGRRLGLLTGKLGRGVTVKSPSGSRHAASPSGGVAAARSTGRGGPGVTTGTTRPGKRSGPSILRSLQVLPMPGGQDDESEVVDGDYMAASSRWRHQRVNTMRAAPMHAVP
jgi:hypothetical protein